MRSLKSRLRKLLGATSLLLITVLSLTATGIGSNNDSAQNKKVDEISTQLTLAEINKRLVEIDRLLSQLETVRKTNVTGQQGPAGSVVQEQEPKLRELQTRYQQLLTPLKKQQDLLKEENILRKKLALPVEDEYLPVLLDSRPLNRRFLDEMIYKGADVSLSQRLNKVEEKLIRAWNFELWVIGDHSVTVKKVCFAILIFIIGMVGLKYFIRIMRKRLLPRVSLEPSAIAAFEKLFYYFSLLVIVIVALRIVNIPLTAFTFLGGAIAIGVGFGAQNLINNFISGFIIMAERPIKIGDLIEIEQTIAVVEGIGARCTRIRTGDNVHILVPNSSFLEKNIINWTLSDKMVRAHVTVGIAYGSPVMEVKNLLIKTAKEHKDVLEQPEPFVLFSDFGDNALVFTLYFWVSMTRLLKRHIIESDIRYRIDELFREAGIVIAFPQLDVHFDSNSPLKLELLNKEETGHCLPRK